MRYQVLATDYDGTIAHDGVVPSDALTTGPQHESARWRRGFVSGVVSDAQARGLSEVDRPEAPAIRDTHVQ